MLSARWLMSVAGMMEVVERPLDDRGEKLMLVEVGRSMSRFLKYIGLLGVDVVASSYVG